MKLKNFSRYISFLVFAIFGFYFINLYVDYSNLKSDYLQLIRGEISYFSWHGNIDLVESFVKKEEDFTKKKVKFWSEFLYGSVKNAHQDLVKYWLRKGMIPKECDVSFAIRNGDLEILKLLVEGGYILSGNDLCLASYYSWSEIVKFLIDNGIDVNFVDKNLDTPITSATKFFPTIEVVKLLIEYGADLTVRNAQGKTPLDLANDRLDEYSGDKRFLKVRDFIKSHELQAKK